ncbi:MAG: enoyl-CoA hydratase-related protein [Flavobacteriales bacterium]
MENSVITSFQNGVCTITLNRPDVFNSFDQNMGRSFQLALDEAAGNRNVRCVVITGTGRAFCAGQDLKEVTSEHSPGFKVIVEETYNRSVRRICDMEKPVVAAVNGVAAGAGANIALACDFVVAKSSVKFIQAFANIGLIPDSGGTFWLPRLVGMARAKALTMLGTPLVASEAQAMGLIHQAVDDEAFEDAVHALASKLANMPTRGLGLTKKALHAAMNHDLHAQLKLELDLQFEAAETSDYAEGVQAFLEKRKPQFTGS